MAILGSILKRSFELRERIPKIRKKDGYKQQTKFFYIISILIILYRIHKFYLIKIKK